MKCTGFLVGFILSYRCNSFPTVIISFFNSILLCIFSHISYVYGGIYEFKNMPVFYSTCRRNEFYEGVRSSAYHTTIPLRFNQTSGRRIWDRTVSAETFPETYACRRNHALLCKTDRTQRIPDDGLPWRIFPPNVPGHLVLGMSRQRIQVFFPGIWERYHADYPNVSLNLRQSYTLKMADEIQAGKLDLFVGVDVPAASNLTAVPLASEYIFCLIHDQLLKKYCPDHWEELLNKSSATRSRCI